MPGGLRPAILCGDCHLNEWRLVQNGCCGSANFGLVPAKEFKGDVSINLSDVVRPFVDLPLRDKAPARRSAIGHPEFNPFEQGFGAASDRCPCHVSFSLYPRRVGSLAYTLAPHVPMLPLPGSTVKYADPEFGITVIAYSLAVTGACRPVGPNSVAPCINFAVTSS